MKAKQNLIEGLVWLLFLNVCMGVGALIPIQMIIDMEYAMSIDLIALSILGLTVVAGDIYLTIIMGRDVIQDYIKESQLEREGE